MRITILTLFPEMVEPFLNHSILKRASEQGFVTYEVINFRDFSTNKHKTVDDTPYGGGPGMVLSVEPIFYALESIESLQNTHKILLSPQGHTFDQSKAISLRKQQHIVLICGHYEGFDERVTSLVDEELSIGDYVLTGGELAALTVVDAVVRLIPGVLGDEASYQNDSFFNGLLDYPQYTKPRNFNGLEVPEVLLSGHHENIEKWRKEQSLIKTKKQRPDLYKKYQKTENIK